MMLNSRDPFPNPTVAHSLRRAICSLAISVLTSLLVACTGDSDGGPTEIVQASATIGPDGGILEHPDGVRVEVPAGALSVPKTIRIARTAAGAPDTPPDGHTAATPVYEITPHGLVFNLPVTISMPMPTPPVSEPRLFTATDGTGWRFLEGSADGGRMSWQTMSLSWFLIAWCSASSNDPYPCVLPRIDSQLTSSPPTATTELPSQFAPYVMRRWRVTQAASLNLALTMRAARDCGGDARLTIRPAGYTLGPSGVQFPDPVLDVPLVMLPDPQNDVRSQQTANWNLAFTRSDNGRHAYVLVFRCKRSFGGGQYAVSGTAHFEVDIGPEPSFVSQPADASVVAPETAQFSVTVSGDPAPTLQWQRSDDGGTTWADLPGATATTYTTPATTVSDDGALYRVVATNSAGSATSNVARLSVAAPLVGRWYEARSVDATGAYTFGPSVGVDASGRALAVWHALPPGSAISRTYFASAVAGQPWSAPQDIGGGFTDAYDARIAVAPDGRAAAAWGYRTGNSFRLAVATYDGSTWGAPQRLDTVLDGNTTYHGIAIDASGRAVVVWAQADTSNVTRVYASFSSGAEWSPPLRIDRDSPAGQLEVAVNAQGKGFAVYTDGSTGAWALAAVPLDLATGSAGTPVSVRAGSPALGPRGVAVDAAGAAMLLWVDDAPNGYSLRYSRYAPSTNVWSPPAHLTDDISSLPSPENFAVAGGANGEVVVALQRRSFVTQYEEAVLTAQYRNGTWSPLVKHSQGPYAERPRVAANANGRIALTWLDYDPVAGIYQPWGRIFDGTQWRTAQTLQRLTREAGRHDGHAVAMGDGGHATALWTERPGSSGNVLEAAFFAP